MLHSHSKAPTEHINAYVDRWATDTTTHTNYTQVHAYQGKPRMVYEADTDNNRDSKRKGRIALTLSLALFTSMPFCSRSKATLSWLFTSHPMYKGVHPYTSKHTLAWVSRSHVLVTMTTTVLVNETHVLAYTARWDSSTLQWCRWCSSWYDCT